MAELVSWVRDFAVFGWLGTLDSTAERSWVMSYSPVAGRLDDVEVDQEGRRDLSVGLQFSFPGFPRSLLGVPEGSRAHIRTSGSHDFR